MQISIPLSTILSPQTCVIIPKHVLPQQNEKLQNDLRSGVKKGLKEVIKFERRCFSSFR